MSQKPAGGVRRNVLIVLGAFALLAAMVVAVVLGKSGGDGDLGEGGFNELRKDEFVPALLAARKEAGTWRTVQSTILDGRPKGYFEVTTAWDGKEFTVSRMPGQSKDGVGEFRYVEGDWYYYDPSQSPEKPWIHLDPAQSKEAVGAITREADPRRQLEIFENPRAFQVIGVENVGVAVAVHYRITVAVEQVKRATDNPVVGESGDELVWDVWVDRDDRIVKDSLPVPIAEGIESVRVRTYSAYGKPVRIEVPPVDKTTEAAMVARPETEESPATP